MANASNNAAKFQWEDPFHLDAQLTDDERAVSEAARAYCQEKLAPRVQLAFRNEHTDIGNLSDNRWKSLNENIDALARFCKTSDKSNGVSRPLRIDRTRCESARINSIGHNNSICL